MHEHRSISASLMATALFATGVSAQDPATPAIAKGGTVLSGSIAFSSAGGDLAGTDRRHTLAMGPGFGHFVVDGVAIGADVGYVYLSQGGQSAHQLAIGPALTYFLNSQDRALPHVGGSILLLNLGSNGDSETGFGFSVGAGITILTSEHLGISIDAVYVWERYTPSGISDSVTGNTILVGLSLLGFVR